jgi:hypothetical protein
VAAGDLQRALRHPGRDWASE